jgi:hypothetical protein
MNNAMENTFDTILKDKLKDVSVAPSPQVWENISAGLEQKQQKKRVIYPWLGLAASVLLVSLGAWLFFPMNQAQISTVKVVNVQQMHTRSTNPELIAQENLPKKEVKHSSKPLVLHNVAQLQQDLTLPPISVNTVEPKPSATVLQPEQQEVAILTEAPSIDPAKILNTPTETTLTSAEPGVSKHAKKRIRTLSDLVNFVVAKVDDREEKVLETSSNEAVLSLTSLNVGPLKFKKNNTEK